MDLPQTSKENFLNKFRLWLLRIESECVFPVLPAPPELKIAQMVRKPGHKSIETSHIHGVHPFVQQFGGLK